MTEEIAQEVMVKSMSVQFFYLGITKGLGNELEEKSYKEGYVEYDEKGNVVLEQRFLSSGEMETSVQYNYDERGFLVETQTKSSQDEFTERVTFERDAKGNTLKEFNHYLDNTFDTTVFKYDDQGNLIEIQTTDSDGESEEKETYRYENNRLVEKQVYDEDGELSEREVNIVDDKGNLIRKEGYDKEDELIEEVVNEYDDKSNLIRSATGSGTNKIALSFKYDERGNVIKQTSYDNNGEMTGEVITVYESVGGKDMKKEQREVNKNIGMISEQRFARKYEYEYF